MKFSYPKVIIATTIAALLFFNNSVMAHDEDTPQQLTIISYNTWNEGNEVPKGRQITQDLIVKEHPDFIYLTEIVSKDYVKKLYKKINANLPAKYRYKSFYFSKVGELGIISRYPITEAVSRDHFIKEDIHSIKKVGSFVEGNNVIRVTVRVKGRKLDIYGVQLDYQHYAAALPRGINDVESNGKTTTIANPIRDTKYIRSRNLMSKRTEFMQQLINDAKLRGNATLISGDFNEPSCNDWVESSSQKFAHSGVVYCWDTTKLLLQNGFNDSYRTINPDPLVSPGITWPVYYPHKNTSEVPNIDQQDRIDYIFGNIYINIENAKILGPSVHNLGGKPSDTPHVKSDYYSPTGKWSSDHNAVWLKFNMK